MPQVGPGAHSEGHVREGQGVAGGVEEHEQYVQPWPYVVICQTPVDVQPGPQVDQDGHVSGQRQAEHTQRDEDVLVHEAGQGVAGQNEQKLYSASKQQQMVREAI